MITEMEARAYFDHSHLCECEKCQQVQQAIDTREMGLGFLLSYWIRSRSLPG